MVKVVDKEEGGGLSSWDSQCYIISNICIQLLLCDTNWFAALFACILPSQPPYFYRLTMLLMVGISWWHLIIQKA